VKNNGIIRITNVEGLCQAAMVKLSVVYLTWANSFPRITPAAFAQNWPAHSLCSHFREGMWVYNRLIPFQEYLKDVERRKDETKLPF
jgi:hypothetical protein